MKKITLLLLTILLSLTANADWQGQRQKFDPAKFDAEQQQYITREANLSEQEVARFFPLYREMQKKQRAIFERQRKLGYMKPSDEKGCERAIRERDQIDLELKQIQQTYHNKFLKVLSPSKLWDVLRAEDHFFRFKLRSWSGGDMPRQHQGQNFRRKGK
jgi:Spy/CpxP family protein refolding chaperone